MTTDPSFSVSQSDALRANIQRIEALSERFLAALQEGGEVNPALNGPGADLWLKTAAAFAADACTHPADLLQRQVSYWGQTLAHFAQAQRAFFGGRTSDGEHEPQDAPDVSDDPRFRHPLWHSHPYFRFLKEQYQLNAAALTQSVDALEGLGAAERAGVAFYTRQLISMMAPGNFLATNPEALERAVATEGQSLVDGLENLVEDLEAGHGQLVVRLGDNEAFEPGRTIAATPGSVVFRNEMMELIQYAPSTAEVYRVPLLIFPPWINKYYVLDLTERNSLVRWLVGQGFTVFVVSWVNPDAEMRDVGMEAYVEKGFLQAIEVVREITGEAKINAVGYCLAGTTLALALALLKQRNQRPVASASYLTTLADFGDQGSFTPFLQDHAIEALAAEITARGVMPAFIMSRTFSFLRPDELVYAPAIRSYMMGEAPPAHDLLYWNSDGTNLPARMALRYLRGLFQHNEFAGEGFALLGETLHLRDVDTPLFAVACESDHIAPWHNCYKAVQQMKTRSRCFVLAQSGHIAGIVNPPGRNKYGHFTSSDRLFPPESGAWRESAVFHEGSWWPTWRDWLVRRSGRKVPARTPGCLLHVPICAAPGAYVLEKAKF